MYIQSLTTQDILGYFVKIVIILLINPLHEFAHAWLAYKLGDDTAKRAGRLTLSPLAHVDILGAILLLFCGFGWAKPVPVNPRNFKNPQKGMMLTAIAGPMANLAAAFVGMAALRIIGGDVLTSYFGIMLYFFILINIQLCVFNLIPVLPLDGSRVLTYILPPKAQLWMLRNQRAFYGIVMLLMLTGILSIPVSFLSGLVYRLLAFLTSWIPAVM